MKSQSSLTYLLCWSLLAGSTATSIRHAHEQGASPHVHGFGLCHCCGKPAELPPRMLTPGHSGSCHCHLILFGIELYGGEDSSEPFGPPSGTFPQWTRLAVGVVGDLQLTDTCVAWDLSSSAPCSLTWITPPSLTPPVVPRDSGGHDASRALCDAARQERSGVHLL